MKRIVVVDVVFVVVVVCCGGFHVWWSLELQQQQRRRVRMISSSHVLRHLRSLVTRKIVAKLLNNYGEKVFIAGVGVVPGMKEGIAKVEFFHGRMWKK